MNLDKVVSADADPDAICTSRAPPLTILYSTAEEVSDDIDGVADSDGYRWSDQRFYHILMSASGGVLFDNEDQCL